MRSTHLESTRKDSFAEIWLEGHLSDPLGDVAVGQKTGKNYGLRKRYAFVANA
jgi:hypothetical protein